MLGKGKYQQNSGEGSTESSEITSLDSLSAHHASLHGLGLGLGLQLPVQRSYHREPLGPANFRLTSNIVCNAAGICGSAEISDSAGGGMVGAVGIQGGTVNAAPHRVTFRENESESKAEYCVGEKVDASEALQPLEDLTRFQIRQLVQLVDRMYPADTQQFSSVGMATRSLSPRRTCEKLTALKKVKARLYKELAVLNDDIIKLQTEADIDWNEKFQTILEKPESKSKNKELSELYADFVSIAEHYGSIIIGEKFLDNSEKTIKPSNMGGLAGGIKFMCQGILFKFAVDTLQVNREKGGHSWLYGKKERKDHFAAKAGGHELKGLINMFNHREKTVGIVPGGLRFPLMTLIDYLGYRLIAIAYLYPLTKEKNTLRYGSGNAGETVYGPTVYNALYENDPDLPRAMEVIGKALNLEKHYVGSPTFNGASTVEELYFCGDIEGHKGSDNNFYVLDFHRVFPPEKLSDEEQKRIKESLKHCDKKFSNPVTSHLYRLLRPEHVKSFHVPLCSDASTNFMAMKSDVRDDSVTRDSYGVEYQKQWTTSLHAVQEATLQIIGPDYTENSSLVCLGNVTEMNTNVAESTAGEVGRVRTDKVHLFARHLDKGMDVVALQNKSFSLTDELHKQGINCRHLGRIRRELLEGKWSPTKNTDQIKATFVLVEIIARACKNHLQELWREKMEQTRLPCTEPYKNVAVDYLNMLLRDEDNYWSDPRKLKSRIQHAFHFALQEEEMSETFNIRNDLILADWERDPFLWPMFFNRIQELTAINFTSRLNNLIKSSKGSTLIKICHVDIKSISTKVKKLDLIDVAEGNVLLLQAQQQDHNYSQKLRLFEMASEHFSKAISSNTNNPKVLYAWGVCLSKHSELDQSLVDKNNRLRRANELFRQCCKLLRPKDLCSEFSLDEENLLVDAYFERATILLTIAAHTTLLRQKSAKILPSEKPGNENFQTFKAWKKIRKLFRLIRRKAQAGNSEIRPNSHLNAYSILARMYDNIQSLMKVDFAMDDTSTLIPVGLPNYHHKELRENQLIPIITAYYWCKLYTKFFYSRAVVLLTVENLMRWGAIAAMGHVTAAPNQEHAARGEGRGDQRGQMKREDSANAQQQQQYVYWQRTLFAKAGQLLHAVLLQSQVAFDFQLPEDRITVNIAREGILHSASDIVHLPDITAQALAGGFLVLPPHPLPVTTQTPHGHSVSHPEAMLMPSKSETILLERRKERARSETARDRESHLLRSMPTIGRAESGVLSTRADREKERERERERERDFMTSLSSTTTPTQMSPVKDFFPASASPGVSRESEQLNSNNNTAKEKDKKREGKVSGLGSMRDFHLPGGSFIADMEKDKAERGRRRSAERVGEKEKDKSDKEKEKREEKDKSHSGGYEVRSSFNWHNNSSGTNTNTNSPAPGLTSSAALAERIDLTAYDEVPILCSGYLFLHEKDKVVATPKKHLVHLKKEILILSPFVQSLSNSGSAAFCYPSASTLMGSRTDKKSEKKDRVRGLSYSHSESEASGRPTDERGRKGISLRGAYLTLFTNPHYANYFQLDLASTSINHSGGSVGVTGMGSSSGSVSTTQASSTVQHNARAHEAPGLSASLSSRALLGGGSKESKEGNQPSDAKESHSTGRDERAGQGGGTYLFSTSTNVESLLWEKHLQVSRLAGIYVVFEPDTSLIIKLKRSQRKSVSESSAPLPQISPVCQDVWRPTYNFNHDACTSFNIKVSPSFKQSFSLERPPKTYPVRIPSRHHLIPTLQDYAEDHLSRTEAWFTNPSVSSIQSTFTFDFGIAIIQSIEMITKVEKPRKGVVQMVLVVFPVSPHKNHRVQMEDASLTLDEKLDYIVSRDLGTIVYNSVIGLERVQEIIIPEAKEGQAFWFVMSPLPGQRVYPLESFKFFGRIVGFNARSHYSWLSTHVDDDFDFQSLDPQIIIASQNAHAGNKRRQHAVQLQYKTHKPRLDGSVPVSPRRDDEIKLQERFVVGSINSAGTNSNSTTSSKEGLTYRRGKTKGESVFVTEISQASFLSNILTSNTWLHLMAVVAGSSPVLVDLIALLSKIHRKDKAIAYNSRAANIYQSVAEFTQHRLQAYCLPTTTATTRPEDTTAVPITCATVDSNQLAMANSRFVSTQTLWFLSGLNCDYKLHSVDLSNTPISDIDMLVLLTNAGREMQSLSLRGCTNLTAATVTHIALYCPNLLRLVMWDSPAADLVEVSRTIPVRFLDLSTCRSVVPEIFQGLTNHRTLQYLDISKARPGEYPWHHHHEAGTAGEKGGEKNQGSSIVVVSQVVKDSSATGKEGPGGNASAQAAASTGTVPIGDFVEAVRQWAKLCGSEVLGLNLDSALIDTTNAYSGSKYFTDKVLGEIISHCPNLVFIDVSYLKIGNATIDALTQCKQLKHFIAFGNYEFKAENFKKFLDSCTQLVTTQLSARGQRNPHLIEDFEVFAPLEQKKLNFLTVKKHLRFTSDDKLLPIIRSCSKFLLKVDFSETQTLSDKIFQALAQCVHLEQILVKACDNAKITEGEINNFVRERGSGLVCVDFSGLKITDTTIELLVNASHPVSFSPRECAKHSLQILEIESCEKLTKSCVASLMKCKDLKSLSVQSLKQFIDMEILINLAKALPSLLCLKVGGNPRLNLKNDSSNPQQYMCQMLYELLPNCIFFTK